MQAQLLSAFQLEYQNLTLKILWSPTVSSAGESGPLLILRAGSPNITKKYS